MTQKPEETFRIGSCYASVFLNERGQERPSYRSVSLQRRYRDGKTWKSATTFTLAELPAALAVLEMAMQYVSNREAHRSE